jgi:hypothetical protein
MRGPTSPWSQVKRRGTTPAPANITPPTVSAGSRGVGVGETMSVADGAWSNTTSFNRRWTRDGVVIGGATSATYVGVNADCKKAQLIRCEVQGVGPGGTSSWVPSSNSLVCTLESYFGSALKGLLDERGQTYVGSGLSTWTDQSGSGWTFTNTTPAERPQNGRSIGGYAAPDFDGARFLNLATTFSTFVGTGTFALGMVFAADGAGANASPPWSQPALFALNGAGFQVSRGSSGLQATGFDPAQQTTSYVSLTGGAGDFMLAKHTGTQLVQRVGASTATVSCAAMTSLAANQLMGRSHGAVNLDGAIATAFLVDGALTSNEEATLAAFCGNTYGVSV